MVYEIVAVAGVGLALASGIRIVRPIEVGLIERFGKYRVTANQGFHWIIPIAERMVRVNMTERMVDVPPQFVITKDKLNAEVDAVVYYKIKDPKASAYNVNDHRRQLSSLARTTLRAVVGKMTLTQANEQRSKINSEVEKVLTKETETYGVEVLRVEIQKIEPPQDVQESMNKVVKAEQEKIAAKDMATAAETVADGEKRAEIKKAEGIKQARVLKAEGVAQAIELENVAAQTFFKGEAKELKKLEVTAEAMKNHSKIVIPAGSELVNVMGEIAGVLPIKKKGKKEDKSD